MPYKFTYLLGSCLFLIYWIFLFVWLGRKNQNCHSGANAIESSRLNREDKFTRSYHCASAPFQDDKFELNEEQKIMLGFSLLFGFIGCLSSYFWFTADWWQPETVFGGSAGVEDFILGFTNAGIVSVGYLLFFRELEAKNQNCHSGANAIESHELTDGDKLKRFYHYAFASFQNDKFKIITPLIITPIVTTLLFFMNVPSFYANCLGILAAIIYILIQRKDLIKISVVSGLLLLILSLPIYFLLMYISPGWVEAIWMIDKLSGIIVLGIPVEDYIWYFLSGAVIGIMYPYWSGKRYKFSL